MAYPNLFLICLLFVFVSCSKKSDESDILAPSSGGSESTLNSTPWTTQFGAVTKFPGGDNQLLDVCLDFTIDSSGNSYCAGYTNGALGETNAGSYDAFVMKLNHDGDPVWIRQLGAVTFPEGNASGSDYCRGVEVDDSGNVYCAGQTSGPLGESYGGGTTDAFVMKLNSNGELVWLKHFGAVTTGPGGSNAGFDSCEEVSVDSSGNVFCAGGTSGNMAETNGGGGFDVIVMKLNSSGDLVWLKQLGAITTAPGGSTAGYEVCYGVSVDSAGNVFCGGITNGSLGEVAGGSNDAFVSKFDPNGNLLWLKQIGAATTTPGTSAAGNDWCYTIKVDSNGDAFCAGQTNGPLGETAGGASDAFVMKISSAGQLLWIRQLGAVSVVPPMNSSSTDSCQGLGFDSSGNVFCSGSSKSSLGDSNAGQEDAIAVKLSSSGDLLWIKQFGSTAFPDGRASQRDFLFGIGVDAIGNVYCGGYTNGTLGEGNGGVGASPSDVIVLKFSPES
jgi:Beta-propeller repeat